MHKNVFDVHEKLYIMCEKSIHVLKKQKSCRKKMFVLYNKNVKCVSKKIGHMFNGKKGKKAQKIRSKPK